MQEFKPFLSPRFWPTWLYLLVLRLLTLSPRSVQFATGRLLGRLLYCVLGKRRHIVKRNLELCFPEKGDAERKQMAVEVFENNAIGFIETAHAWWSKPESFKGRVRYEGFERIEAATAEGKGVILVGGHFSTLDMGGFLFGQRHSICTLYRPHNNALLDYFMRRGRQRFTRHIVDNRNTRQLIRLLRKGEVIWLAPDQDMGPTNSIYASFFGIQAATVPTVSRLAKISGAEVMMFAQYRLPGDNGYELKVSPALTDFPSEDEVADTQRINDGIEANIRKYPAQYMWVHRRFKTHPAGKNFLYH